MTRLVVSFLLVSGLAAVAVFPTPSHAYFTPGKTTGTEFALIQVAGSSWDLTLETDGNANAGGQVGILNAVSFDPDPLCDDLPTDHAICAGVDGDQLAAETGDPFPLGSFYVVFAVDDPGGTFNTGVNSPRRVGGVGGTDPLLTVEGLRFMTGSATDTTGFPEPVDFYRVPVPEPNSFALAALGIACLALRRQGLRRRRAQETAPEAAHSAGSLLSRCCRRG